MKTTLAILALNEVEAIQVVVPQIDRSWVDEIFVVDGGSTDGTIEWAEAQGLKVLRQKRRGYGAGMREVMEIATGDVVIEFMADGNCDPAAIPKLVRKINEGYDLVIGSRFASPSVCATSSAASARLRPAAMRHGLKTTLGSAATPSPR